MMKKLWESISLSQVALLGSGPVGPSPELLPNSESHTPNCNAKLLPLAKASGERTGPQITVVRECFPEKLRIDLEAHISIEVWQPVWTLIVRDTQ